MMVFASLFLLLVGGVTAGRPPSLFMNNYNSADLYAIANQWAANFDPDLIISVWSKVVETNGLSDQENCLTGLNHIVRAFLNNETAAARFFDSWGKPGNAILQGNFIHWGSYDECIDLKDTSINETNYCRFRFLAKVRNVSLPLEVGLCFPSGCSAYDFNRLINSTLAQINKFVGSSGLFPVKAQFTVDPNNPPRCPWRDLEYDGGVIAVLVVFAILCVLVMMGSLLDGLLWYYQKWCVKPNPNSFKDDVSLSVNKVDGPVTDGKKSNEKCLNVLKELLLCFSLYRTVPEILGTEHPPNGITCINGVRVISMFWIILGHTFQTGANLGISFNLYYSSMHTVTRFTFQVIANAFKGVDSFLLLSGLLLGYLGIREMERRKGKIPFVFFYIFRFIRLSPLYYLILFFWYKILPLMGEGPNWYWQAPRYCKDYWWTNILYINNFYPRDFFDTCFSVSWYLAVDTQIFMITPIFLYLLYYCWPAGVAALIGTIFASWITTGVIVGVNDYHANLVKYALNAHGIDFEDVMRDVYEAPYCRAGAYLVGMLLGFVLHKKWQPRKDLRVRVPFYSAVWIVGLACSITPVYAFYWSFNGHTFSTFENVVYLALSNTGFSIGVSCIIYACHHGYGFIINTILSWNFWIPLSRLTYAVYLLHIPVIVFFYASLHSRGVQDDYQTILWYSAAVMWTYAVALLFAAFIEFPFINLMIFGFKLAGYERRSRQSDEVKKTE